MTLEQLIYTAGQMSGKDCLAIARNAGGVYNHQFFFNGMCSGGKKAPEGALAAAISIFTSVIVSRALINLIYGRQKKLTSVHIGQIWRPDPAKVQAK